MKHRLLLCLRWICLIIFCVSMCICLPLVPIFFIIWLFTGWNLYPVLDRFIRKHFSDAKILSWYKQN